MRGRRPAFSTRRLASLLALGLLLGLAACGTGPSGTPGPSATAAPPASSGGRSSPNPSAAAVTVDIGLLAVLPATVDGVPVTEYAEGETDAQAVPDLRTIGNAIVAAVAVDTGSSDLVYALVVRLRANGLTDATFRDWRDSYDEGACGQRSAVLGNGEAQIGGRTVFVGTCATGIHTYHVWIADKGILISASAVGTRQLGVILLTNLKP